MSISLNSSGVSHARSLIRSGKVKNSDAWNGPSADKENAYIEKHGIGSYGKWFLGIHSESPSDTKGHYGYPFTDDFETVNIKGLKAAKARAAQQGASGIEKAADSLIGHHDKKEKGDASAEYTIDVKRLVNGSIKVELNSVDNLKFE